MKEEPGFNVWRVSDFDRKYVGWGVTLYEVGKLIMIQPEDILSHEHIEIEPVLMVLDVV